MSPSSGGWTTLGIFLPASPHPQDPELWSLLQPVRASRRPQGASTRAWAQNKGLQDLRAEGWREGAQLGEWPAGGARVLSRWASSAQGDWRRLPRLVV